MGTGEAAALQAGASDGEVGGQWSLLFGTRPGSAAGRGGGVILHTPPPGSCPVPVQVAVNSCVASSPALQRLHAPTFCPPLQASESQWLTKKGAGSNPLGWKCVSPLHLQNAAASPGQVYLVAGLRQRPLRATVVVPSGVRSWDYPSVQGNCFLSWSLGIALCPLLGCQQTPRAYCGHASLKTSVCCALQLCGAGSTIFS